MLKLNEETHDLLCDTTMMLAEMDKKGQMSNFGLNGVG